MKFDVVFSNPPYENIDIKILTKIHNLADEFIVVHPASWVLDKKGKQPVFNNFKPVVQGKTKSLEFFNASVVFGIAQSTPCVISHFDMNGSTQIDVDYFNNKFQVNDIDEVSPYGDKWNDLVAPFIKKISDEISSTYGSLWSNWDKKQTVDESKFYVQLSQIRGNMSDNALIPYSDDFYTMVMPNSDANKGIRLKKNIDTVPLYAFHSEIEQDNFINYLKTDFARFCLSIYKKNTQLARGELALIPWLDFTQEWDDDKLFNHFDVADDLQILMRNFLPDYHQIRK